jgi:hypothetical protein
VVDIRPGLTLGSALGGPTVYQGGTHGYAATHPELLARFLISGPRIRKNLELGEIYVRSIAPTLASWLGASLTTPDLSSLDIAEAGSGAAK